MKNVWFQILKRWKEPCFLINIVLIKFIPGKQNPIKINKVNISCLIKYLIEKKELVNDMLDT